MRQECRTENQLYTWRNDTRPGGVYLRKLASARARYGYRPARDVDWREVQSKIARIPHTEYGLFCGPLQQ